ncbi:MAG: hypothetical protein Q8L09_03810 [Candidatus Moranbacteria bacterium]|nr:hypothetical protein [Candidatus Moranbacteria bacterium]
MADQKKKRKTSTVEEEPSPSQTPQAEDSLQVLAYELAKKTKEDFDEFKINSKSPEWAQKLIDSQLSLQRVMRIIFWLFFTFLVFVIISFILFSVFELNNLLNVLEYIRDSKRMEQSDEILKQYNQLFFYCKSITTFFASVIGTLGIIGFFIFIFTKVSENLTKNIINKDK